MGGAVARDAIIGPASARVYADAKCHSPPLHPPFEQSVTKKSRHTSRPCRHCRVKFCSVLRIATGASKTVMDIETTIVSLPADVLALVVQTTLHVGGLAALANLVVSHSVLFKIARTPLFGAAEVNAIDRALAAFVSDSTGRLVSALCLVSAAYRLACMRARIRHAVYSILVNNCDERASCVVCRPISFGDFLLADTPSADIMRAPVEDCHETHHLRALALTAEPPHRNHLCVTIGAYALSVIPMPLTETTCSYIPRVSALDSSVRSLVGGTFSDSGAHIELTRTLSAHQRTTLLAETDLFRAYPDMTDTLRLTCRRGQEHMPVSSRPDITSVCLDLRPILCYDPVLSAMRPRSLGDNSCHEARA